jgi:hypothetical protein
MYQPADLIFTRHDWVLGPAIAWITQGYGDEPTFATHVAGFVTDIDIVEALATVKRNPARRYVYTEHEVWRCCLLSEEHKLRIAAKANDYLGRKYGFSKILTHALDGLLVKVFKRELFVFRKLNHVQRYPICSWIWAFAYEKMGFGFGVPANYITPDDMHDWVVEGGEDGSWMQLPKLSEIFE